MTQSLPELGPPQPLAENGLRVVALGGLGEVGRNMAVLEHRGKLLVIDCGVLFPEDNQPGVDLILPDFSYIADRLQDVLAVVLTHGHEDHIGAVPYLLRLRPDLPLIGSQLTLAFVEAKLKEHRITPYTLAVREGQIERLGPFECEFVAVNHSIPDALAVAVRTSAGTVLHTGDFKMDQLPLDGRLTDLRAFARLGEAGVDLFMVDSTNAEVPGFTTSEREISPVLDRVFAQARRRIIVASFASHVHRVQQVLDAAATHGRNVAFIGRSMVRNMGIARDLGLLRIPAGLVVGVEEAMALPPERIVLMSTGSQGEPMSALGRMATGDHRYVNVGPGDTVVLASSLVPGNETAVYRVINQLSRAGAFVVHKDVAKVHVSGHSPAGELLYLLNVVKPRNFMPVHGEWRHLRAHARLAVESGVPADRVVLCEDGDVVDLVRGRARLVGHVRSRYVYVDGLAVGDVGESLLTERRILGDGGFIAATVVIDSVTGKVVAGPTVSAKGFSEDPAAFDPVIPLVTEALDRAALEG
ncbi:MAG TPA: ribonuclease J, partial [Kineosporiaceae bacterium]|nr:ribonuclease J [Kineosporiaceae bacterium]